MEGKIARWALITAILFALMVAVAIVSMAIGPANVSPEKVVAIILSKVPVIQDHITRNWTTGEESIILQVRLPRVILGLLVGASLALAGVTTQGIFKNPMADPYIIGVSSGATLGAALVIVVGVGAGILGGVGITVGALIGGLAVSFLVFNIARVGNKIPVETVLLTGVAVSTFFWAMTSFLMYVSGRSLNIIVFWVMGALWNSNWNNVFTLLPFLLLGAFVIYAFARDLNLMLLGEESAAHLGSDVNRAKTILLAGSTVVAAAAVSVSGIIAFVGLIVPHIMRLIVGPDHRILIPASVLVGAMFLVLSDTLARMIVQPTEMPVGIVTSMIGAPFFVYLLIKQKKALKGL